MSSARGSRVFVVCCVLLLCLFSTRAWTNDDLLALNLITCQAAARTLLPFLVVLEPRVWG